MTMSSNTGRWPPAGALDDPNVPLVVLDLASVESYFLVQPLSWLAVQSEGAIWLALQSPPAPLDLDRDAAEGIARGLQLPLNRPARHPRPVSKAMRVAALACAHGLGASVMFGMTRLAFGGQADLDDPEHYLSASEGIGLDGEQVRLAAEDGSVWDRELTRIAKELARVGIACAPALRWRGEIHLGSRAISPVLAESPSLQPPLDPHELDGHDSPACSPG